MNVKMEEDGRKLTIYLEERIGASASSVIREMMQNVPDNVEKIIFDFSNVYYIASAGLRELMISTKKYGDKLSVVNVSDEVYRIFEITGFSELISVQRSDGTVLKNIYLSFRALIQKRAKDHPDRPAVICESGIYTWSDIYKISQVVASELEKKGVRVGTHVAMCGTNSINWIITFFALQKLGAIAVLLNANMKAEEIINAAKIGDITHLCYGQMPEMKDEMAFKEEVTSDSECPILSFYSFRDDRDLRALADKYESVKNDYRSSIDPDFPCVMLFTSGSTGKPKGVLLSAYNMLNASDAFVQALHMEPDDRTCLILPLFHILAQVTFLAGALVGAVTIIPKDIRTSTLLDVIEDQKCTIMNSVPTMLLALLNNKDFEAGRVSSLRCTVIAGAVATPAQIKLFKDKMPTNHFMEAYGLSEMAPVSMTLYEDTEEHITGTVGKPVRNIEIKIFDNDKNRECETGVSGEIHVQGYNLMAGYYKVAPDQQAIDEEGFLRTGDLGFLDEEGYLHLSGRLKELIIRGGENIMPIEIETAVSSIPEIEMVRVFGVPDAFFGEEVCACIKMKDNNEFDEEHIRGVLAGKLSKFKIPKYILCYDALPMLGSGKIDTVELKKEVVSKLGLK